MNKLKINEVVYLIVSENVDLDYCSPNYVAQFSYNRGIELTSNEVVYITNNLDQLIKGLEDGTN